MTPQETDLYWHTVFDTRVQNQDIIDRDLSWMREARKQFDAVADKYRDQFVPCEDGLTVCGSFLIPVAGGWLTTPRIKTANFTSADAVFIYPKWYWPRGQERTIMVGAGGKKATLNAPLLIRVADRYLLEYANRAGDFILHLHAYLPDVSTVPYFPPGSDKDNSRVLPGRAFNIENHGFVAVLPLP